MKQKTRYLFFDLLRGWSLIVMMEAHVFNAFMQPPLRDTWWFGIMNYVNGLVAPTFLFVSGALFYITTYNKTDELRRIGPSFRKKLYRIAFIFLAAYSLHLPFLSLQDMIHKTDEGMLKHFYSVDILHCIAFGLLLILVFRTLIKNDRLYLLLTGVLSILLILISPFSWGTDLSGYVSLPFIGYLTPAYGSLFPLLPWLSFLLAGVLFAHLFLVSRESGSETLFMRNSMAVGVVLVIAGHLLLSALFVPESVRLIRPNPIFVFQRMGYVLLFISTSWYFARRTGERKSFITVIGAESLMVYWLHLQVIYRRFSDDTSIASLVNNSFSALQSAGALLVLLVIITAAAVYWNRLKLSYPGQVMLAVRTVVWALIIVFFLS